MCGRVRAPLLAAVIAVLLAPVPGGAASREQQQMMADIRMLQEQTQQLQALIAGLTDALKTVTAKLDDQAALNRKAFADERVMVDTVSGDVRIVREKVDETNVRLSSLSQDLEALRLAIPQLSAPPASPPADAGALPAAGAAPPAPAPTPAAPAPGPGMSPQRLYDTAWADYTAGQWTSGHPGLRDLPPDLPEVGSGRRRAVQHRGNVTSPT